MRKTFEFRIRPTRAQERRLLATLSACRFVYNWAVADRRDLWNLCHVSTNFCDQSKYLKILKAENPWLSDVHAHPLQDALKRVDLAFQAFFRRCKSGEKSGHPRFKGRDWYDSFTFKEWGNGALFSGKRLSLSKIGRVRIVLHRPVDGEIRTCTIRRKADGWYATFSVEIAISVSLTGIDNPVGLDVGLASFATLSTGEKIENPRHLRANERKLKIAQRKVSRRKNCGHRRRVAVQHLALEHQRVARTRKDFHFKIARDLAGRFSPIFVEDLRVGNMLKNHSLAKSISDAAWGQFLGILSRQAESAAGAVIRVEARGSSQECSRCGCIVPKDLSVRIHVCPRCGLMMDRDENSANVIMNRGLGRAIGEGWATKLAPRIREAAPL